MRRFLMNRWWTFVLALLVSVAGAVSLTGNALADTGTSTDDSSDSRTPNAPPNPQGTGDPDFPSTPGRNGGKPGAMRLGSPSQFGVSASGEGVSVTSRVWMIRFRVAMRMLRAYYLR